jgi:hypothetical protein
MRGAVGLFGGKKKKQAPADTEQAVSSVWTKNMELRVAAPSASGWQRAEAVNQPGGLLAAVKCMHGEPPDALLLDAYVYASSDHTPPTVAELCQRDWQAQFEQQMFASVDTVLVAEVQHAVRGGFQAPACEVTVEGRLRNPDQACRVRERHVPAGQKLLRIVALGSPAQHERFAKVVDSWLAHATLGGE